MKKLCRRALASSGSAAVTVPAPSELTPRLPLGARDRSKPNVVRQRVVPGAAAGIPAQRLKRRRHRR
jgi:hypothetical protein